MPEVLTQKQIDEMLQNLSSGEKNINAMQDEVVSKKLKEYDFRSPKKFTREQIKLLNSIYDNFARLLCLQLSSMLRVSCQMEVMAVEEQQYAEFNNALSDSVLIGTFDLLSATPTTDEKQMLMQVSRPVSFSLIDRLMGGSGDTYDISRDYSEIELSLLEYVFRHMSSSLKSAWVNYLPVDAEFRKIETNSRLIQSIMPDDTVVIVVCDFSMKGLTDKINICLPGDTLSTLFRLFDAKFAKSAKRGDAEAETLRRDGILSSLGSSELLIKAMLGQTEINVQELLTLQAGDVLVLKTPVHGSHITLEVEDLPWFRGQVGAHKKRYAVRVDEVLDENIGPSSPFN